MTLVGEIPVKIFITAYLIPYNCLLRRKLVEVIYRITGSTWC